MDLIKNFIRETFLGADEPIHIDEIPVADGGPKDLERAARVDVVIIANRLIATTLCLTISFIVIYPFVQPDRKIPDVIQNIASGCIGYFVSIVTVFLNRRGTSQS